MQNLLLLSFAAPQMWLQIVLFVVGIVVVLWGADRLTDGAVGLAARMGMSQLVIGLTIVAMGTSMPEFFVSLMSAIHGTPDLAVGNIVGSNIFNSLSIVGCAAMVMPIAIVPGTVRKDIPFAIIASVVLLMLCLDSRISRIDAAILFVLFIYFMYATLHISKQEQPAEETTQEEERPTMSMGKSLLLIIVGLTCLVFGSSVFVDNASAIASSLGMSDALIGLTIVAGGTSLPELATSVVAARRGNSGIAIGNVVGSNVFNILMILGVTGLITPMHIAGISYTDLSVMVGSMILLWLFSFTKYRIERWEGGVLVLSFAVYMTYLISQAV
jgi:cation:H+ antiporter